MGLGASRHRFDILMVGERRGVVVADTAGVSTGSCLEAGPIPLVMKSDNHMDLFTARDVSRASTALCALNAHGKVVKEAKVDSEP